MTDADLIAALRAELATMTNRYVTERERCDGWQNEASVLRRQFSDAEAERDDWRDRYSSACARSREYRAERDAMRAVVDAAVKAVDYMTPHHWATLAPAVVVPSMHAMRNAVDAYRGALDE